MKPSPPRTRLGANGRSSLPTGRPPSIHGGVIRFTVSIPIELYEQVEEAAREGDRPITAQVVRLVRWAIENGGAES